MKGILWNGALRLQRIGLSDAEPPPSPLFYCFGREIFRFAVILWNPTPCKAVVGEGSEKRLCTSQEHRKYLLKASSVSPCVNIPGVHVRGCQHLYGLWMKEAACSELGTPARQHWAWQAQQSGCCLVPAPQKKESGFLATERFMTCDWNFYLNPENRTGLILISQETAAGGGAGRRQLSVGSSFPLFPPGFLLLSDLQLLLLLPPSPGERRWTKQRPFGGLWHPQAKRALLQAGLPLCCSIAHGPALPGFAVAVSRGELVAHFTPSLIALKPARLGLAQFWPPTNCTAKTQGCKG